MRWNQQHGTFEFLPIIVPGDSPTGHEQLSLRLRPFSPQLVLNPAYFLKERVIGGNQDSSYPRRKELTHVIGKVFKRYVFKQAEVNDFAHVLILRSLPYG
jgi:hypothetical protein